MVIKEKMDEAGRYFLDAGGRKSEADRRMTAKRPEEIPAIIP